MLRPKKQYEATFIADPWARLAMAYLQARDRQALDRLVERRPKFAGQMGDLFAADRDWPRAVEIYSRGIPAKTTDVVLLSKRARAYEALKNWDSADADWSRVAEGNPDGAELLGDFARRLAVSDQMALANSHFEKAQAHYERSLKADANNDLVAMDLVQLLLDKQEYAPANPGMDEKRSAVLKFADPWLRLGAAYALNGRDGEVFRFIDKAIQQPDTKKTALEIVALRGFADLLRGPLLDDATKSNLRSQILALLRAELADRRKELDSDNAVERATVFRGLNAWQMDGNLAGLRESAALAELPANEQKALGQFWTEVAELSLKTIAALPADKQVVLMAEWLKERNPGYDGTLTHKGEGNMITALELPSPLVQDLTPLLALPGLRSLTCRTTLGYGNKAESDAAVLRSLKSLETINGKPVAEFWKNVNARQAEFNAWLKRVPTLPAKEQVKEVTAKLKERNPGVKLNLTNISEGELVTEILIHEANNLTDLSPVRALVSLKSFNTYASTGGHLTDLSPLGGMKSLTIIHLSEMKVKDLSPLKELPLTALALEHCPLVKDLTPLKGMKLTKLSLVGCEQVQDFSPLKGMPLASLNLHLCTQIEDLTPLKGMPLTILNLHGCVKVVDLKPLKDMKLTELWLGNAKVRDLSPLKGLPLDKLALSHCRELQDVSPLQGLPLKTLYLDDTKVRDISPLKGMPLKQLYIDTSAVTDVTPLQSVPLQDIRLTAKNITRGLEVLRGMKSLKTIGTDHYNDWPAAKYWARYDKGEFKN